MRTASLSMPSLSLFAGSGYQVMGIDPKRLIRRLEQLSE